MSGATHYALSEAAGKPLIIVAEGLQLKVEVIDNPDHLPVIFYTKAIDYIYTNIRSHILLHGASVSWNGDGLAILGNSGLGKSVLTLQLALRNGFKFLSDDQIAVNRETLLLEPFPRSVGIRENTLNLFKDIEPGHLPARMTVEGKRKWFIDISEISGNEIGEACRLRYLILLVNSLNEKDRGENFIELIVDDTNDRLVNKLRSLAGEGELDSKSFGGCYVFQFYPKIEIDTVLEIENLCKDHGVRILCLRELSDAKVNYSMIPEIKRVDWRMAADELLKGLQNDFRSDPGQIFMELAGLLEDVECYQLSAGRLDDMASHICNLVT